MITSSHYHLAVNKWVREVEGRTRGIKNRSNNRKKFERNVRGSNLESSQTTLSLRILRGKWEYVRAVFYTIWTWGIQLCISKVHRCFEITLMLYVREVDVCTDLSCFDYTVSNHIIIIRIKWVRRIFCLRNNDEFVCAILIIIGVTYTGILKFPFKAVISKSATKSLVRRSCYVVMFAWRGLLSEKGNRP